MKALPTKIVLGSVIAILALLAAHFLMGRSRKIVSTDQSGRTVTTERINEGVTSASGDCTAAITIKYPDDTPASNHRFRLELPLSSSNVIAATGILSTNGEAVIDGLAGGWPPVFYQLYVEDFPVGEITLTSNRTAHQLLLPAKAGMQASDLLLTDLTLNKTFRLSDLRGQIVFLEFYTTRCAPCQPILAELNTLLQRRGKEWKGKVSILAVGLDAVWQPDRSKETVEKHLRRRGWDSIHAIVPAHGFSSRLAERFPFGVSAVPHSFLIGSDGTIVWSGIPAVPEIEQTIDHLLNDESRR